METFNLGQAVAIVSFGLTFQLFGSEWVAAHVSLSKNENSSSEQHRKNIDFTTVT